MASFLPELGNDAWQANKTSHRQIVPFRAPQLTDAELLAAAHNCGWARRHQEIFASSDVLTDAAYGPPGSRQPVPYVYASARSG